MKQIVLLCLTALFCSAAIAADKQPQVHEAWARASGAGPVSAAYFAVKNPGEADRLVGVAADVAAIVEMHAHTKDGDVMRMRKVDGVDLPANGMLRFQPGGLHVMLINLRHPLEAGQSFPLTLRFEKAGDIVVDVTVRPMGAASGGNHGGVQPAR